MMTFIALAVMAAAQPLPSVEDFLKDFAAKRGDITALKADFVQENRTSGETDTVTGTIFYANPRRIIFRYPEQELTYVFDDLRVYEYDAGLQQVQMHELEDNPQTEALFLGFGEDVGRLQQAYRIALFQPKENECGDVGMTLRPKTERAEDGMFQEVRLYLRGENLLPCRVVIVNDEASTVTINVTNLRLNPPFQGLDTQVRVPEGTRIVREDQDFGTAGPEGLLIPDTPILSMADLPAPEKAPAP
jgi:outer membrane lipoprotein-sorting protein